VRFKYPLWECLISLILGYGGLWQRVIVIIGSGDMTRTALISLQGGAFIIVIIKLITFTHKYTHAH